MSITDATVVGLGQSPHVRTFRQRFKGQLIEPGDDNYEAARRVWNGAIDRRPRLIARCTDRDDAIAAIDFARETDLLLAVRGGGHNFAGFG